MVEGSQQKFKVMENKLKLIHKTTERVFIYLGEFKPQFSSDTFVRLLNTNTGKEERFLKRTYLNFFEKVLDKVRNNN